MWKLKPSRVVVELRAGMHEVYCKCAWLIGRGAWQLRGARATDLRSQRLVINEVDTVLVGVEAQRDPRLRSTCFVVPELIAYSAQYLDTQFGRILLRLERSASCQVSMHVFMPRTLSAETAEDGWTVAHPPGGFEHRRHASAANARDHAILAHVHDRRAHA